MKVTRSELIKSKYKRYDMGNVEGYKLRDVYGRWSDKKEEAFDRCVDLVRSYDGHGLAIMSHNDNTFSVGFIGYIDGLKHFFYITKDNDRCLPLEKMNPETGEVISL